MTSEPSEIQFTALELAVLRMIVGNMTLSEIAFALDVEQSAVSDASENIFRKLNATDFKSASEIATELNLVKLEL